MIVTNRPELLDLGFGSGQEFDTIKVLDIVLTVKEYKKEKEVEVLGKISKPVKLKKGDRIVCRWVDVVEAMNNMDGDLILPLASVVAKYGDKIEPVHGYELVYNVEHQDMYGIKRGIRQDVSRGETDTHIIYFERLWGFPVQQEPYVSMDRQYYYIHKDNVSVWITKK